MIGFTPGLYVRISEVDGGPMPRPLDNGFSKDCAYLVLGGFTMSESSEMFLALANNTDELWFISNRHVRVDHVDPTNTATRLYL